MSACTFEMRREQEALKVMTVMRIAAAENEDSQEDADPERPHPGR